MIEQLTKCEPLLLNKFVKQFSEATLFTKSDFLNPTLAIKMRNLFFSKFSLFWSQLVHYVQFICGTSPTFSIVFIGNERTMNKLIENSDEIKYIPPRVIEKSQSLLILQRLRELKQKFFSLFTS